MVIFEMGINVMVGRVYCVLERSNGSCVSVVKNLKDGESNTDACCAIRVG